MKNINKRKHRQKEKRDQQPDNVNTIQQHKEKGQNQNKKNHNNSIQQPLIQEGAARTSVTTQQELQGQGHWQVQRRKGYKGANSFQQHNTVSTDKEVREPVAAMQERVSPSDENVALGSGNVPVILENARVVHADQTVSQAFTKNKFDALAVNGVNPPTEMELQGKNQIDASLGVDTVSVILDIQQPGKRANASACAISDAAGVTPALHSVAYIDPDQPEPAAALTGMVLQRNEVSAEVAVTEVPTSDVGNSIMEFNALATVRDKGGVTETKNEIHVTKQVVPKKVVKDTCVSANVFDTVSHPKSAEQNNADVVHMINDQVKANFGELIFNDLAEIDTGASSKKITLGGVENLISPAVETGCHNTPAVQTNEPAHDIVQAPVDSTKAWIEKSFGKSPICQPNS